MFLLLPRGEQESVEFDRLVDQYERRIFNLVFRLIGDYDEAADLTQDTFVAAYRSFASFRSESSPYTWLYRIAVNVCKNRFRERDKRRSVEGPSLDDEAGLGAEMDCSNAMADPLPAPDRALEREELRGKVEEAISGLPEDYKVVAVLRDLHGLSYREISEATEMSVDVVKTRLARARGMLRRKLGDFL
jgi:RNA polymerase sigma-70 factor, ECF subfamily